MKSLEVERIISLFIPNTSNYGHDQGDYTISWPNGNIFKSKLWVLIDTLGLLRVTEGQQMA